MPALSLSRLAAPSLLLLSLPVLLISGLVLTSVVTGAGNSLNEPADLARHAAYPLSLGVHILGGIAMLTLGILQITPAFRCRFPRWHRFAGRLLVAGGIGIALTGLAMNASANAAPNSLVHNLAQDVVAVGLIFCLAAGIIAIRRKAVARHRVWMVRAYALTLGAATQTLLLFPVFLLVGVPTGPLADTVFVGAWAINLTVAEIFLRRPPPRSLLQ